MKVRRAIEKRRGALAPPPEPHPAVCGSPCAAYTRRSAARSSNSMGVLDAARMPMLESTFHRTTSLGGGSIESCTRRMHTPSSSSSCVKPVSAAHSSDGAAASSATPSTGVAPCSSGPHAMWCTKAPRGIPLVAMAPRPDPRLGRPLVVVRSFQAEPAVDRQASRRRQVRGDPRAPHGHHKVHRIVVDAEEVERVRCGSVP